MPKLDLTDAEIRIIGGALGELPFKTVANLVYKIDAQLEDQRKEAEKVAATESANTDKDVTEETKEEDPVDNPE